MGLDMVRIKLVKEQNIYSDRKISCPDDAADVLNEYLGEFDREVFCILNLKADGNVINMNIVSQGTLTSAEVSPREVFKSSILSNAAVIIAFHNHPSGNISPSKEDYDITKRLKECGDILGINLVDHIIVGANGRGSYSLAAHGELGLDHFEVADKKRGYER